MMKKTEEQTKKRGMHLVATFGAVTLIALGALAVGMLNPKDGTVPKKIDLNATPTPGQPTPTDAERTDTVKNTTPVPTGVPAKEPAGDGTQIPEQTTPITQTADGTQAAMENEGEDAATVSTNGIIDGLDFSVETGMLWPVTGEALISFSPDHAVYHKTLDSYRTSNYVLLGSEPGMHVVAAADGVVTAVKEELKTGTTVTMRVSTDHEIVYGMLSDVTVKEGDYVDAGTVFATVAEPTRYFCEDGSGVYLQVREKEEAINPMLFLQ